MRRLFYIIVLFAALLYSCESSTLQLVRRAEYQYQQGDTQKLDRIIEVLKENTDASRDAALALGRLGDKRATPFLVEVIRNEEVAVQEAIAAIGMLQDVRAVIDLIQVIKQNRPAAPAAVQVLGKMRDPRALHILMSVIEENRPYSLLAIDALGEIQSKEAASLLLSKLKQPPAVRPENILFRISREEQGRQHNLTVEMPANLPPKIEILDKIMQPEGNVIFTYLLRDTEFDSLDIKAEFSVDAGSNWHDASTTGRMNTILEDQYRGSLTWLIEEDVKLDELQNKPNLLLFKLTPIDRFSRDLLGVPALTSFNVDTTTIDIQAFEEEESGDIPIRFYYPNPARAVIDSFVFHYTIDGGSTWNPASFRPFISGALIAQDTVYTMWSSNDDLPNIDIESVQLRISENINNTYGRYDISPLFHLDNNTVPQIVFLNFNEDRDGLFYIGYEINDIEGDIISLGIQYSDDQGTSWKQATISGTLKDIPPEGYRGEIKWFADFDITDFEKPIRLRIRPSDLDPGQFTDSQDFYLKNTDFTKLTQGLNSGQVEISYTIAPGDTSRPIGQYSLDQGKTWQNASIITVSEQSTQEKKNVTLNWNIGRDIAPYITEIEAVGITLDKIQDPSFVPELLVIARQKGSQFRERRRKAVEASRLLEKKSPWIIEGLVYYSLIHPDPNIQAEALAILETVSVSDMPEVGMAINDYKHYWSEISRVDREERASDIEVAEQVYQEYLHLPRTITEAEMINTMVDWSGFSQSKAKSFIAELEVLRQQITLKKQFEAGEFTRGEYEELLRKLLLDARERRNRERNPQQQNNVIKKNGGK